MLSSQIVIAYAILFSFCNPMTAAHQGSSVFEILQARVLEWVAIPFSKGSS